MREIIDRMFNAYAFRDMLLRDVLRDIKPLKETGKRRNTKMKSSDDMTPLEYERRIADVAMNELEDATEMIGELQNAMFSWRKRCITLERRQLEADPNGRLRSALVAPDVLACLDSEERDVLEERYDLASSSTLEKLACIANPCFDLVRLMAITSDDKTDPVVRVWAGKIRYHRHRIATERAEEHDRMMRSLDDARERLVEMDKRAIAAEWGMTTLRANMTEIRASIAERDERIKTLAGDLSVAGVNFAAMEKRALAAELALADSIKFRDRLQDELAAMSELADERLTHANQLQADIEAEMQGRLALRKRLGARDDETMGAFLERLATMAGVVPELNAAELEKRAEDADERLRINQAKELERNEMLLGLVQRMSAEWERVWAERKSEDDAKKNHLPHEFGKKETET